MNIALLFNPASGNGRRSDVIERITAALRQDGHRILTMRIGSADMDEHNARHTLAAAEALLIAGGDGTINHSLPLARASGVPIYHIPLGTENLFARHFGMSTDIGAIRAALTLHTTSHIDTADANGRPFVVMCSAGPDADVIHRLAATRTGGISHLSYIAPIAGEAFTGGVAPLSLEVDGQILFENRRGMIVVASGEHYALGSNPAHGASMRDGELDVVFFPAPAKLLVAAWLAASRLRIAHLLPGHLRARGQHIVITAPPPGFRVQMDGEAVPGPHHQSRTDQLEIIIRPRSLRVLA